MNDLHLGSLTFATRGGSAWVHGAWTWPLGGLSLSLPGHLAPRRPHLPTIMSSCSDARGRTRFHRSMVKMVLALLKMEVREDMSAATITAIMRPRSPGGTREGRPHSGPGPGPSPADRGGSTPGTQSRGSREGGRSRWGQSPARPGCQLEASAQSLLPHPPPWSLLGSEPSQCPPAGCSRGPGAGGRAITRGQDFQHQFGVRNVGAAGWVATDLLADVRVCTGHLICGGDMVRGQHTEPQAPGLAEP